VRVTSVVSAMLACVDVDYRTTGAVAACLLFEGWADEAEREQLVERVGEVAAYEPGAFYLRELPCLMAVLSRVAGPLAAVVVDGYVWLDGAGKPGLGAHLHAALGGGVAVVGVAKTRFEGATLALPVLRGNSKHPLWVSAAGMGADEAAALVAAMAGGFRLPTLLKRVDRLCRDA
jgi:deoxyribonuclease V